MVITRALTSIIEKEQEMLFLLNHVQPDFAPGDEPENAAPRPAPKDGGWIKVIFLALIFSLLFNQFVIINASVPSGSMLNTIQNPSRNIAFRLAYLFGKPERFDIVVFPAPDDGTLYVKRIIGLPGEKVEIRSGKVYINDSATPLDDSFVDNASNDNWGPRVVPENHYFMLGDNRSDSHDSRKWSNTYVNRSAILGKIIFSYYPSIKFIK